MTVRRAGRRRLPLAELYVLLCTGLTALMALGLVAPTVPGVLFVLLLPAGIVPGAIAVNLVSLTGGGLDGAVWQAASVLLVTLLAVLQAWMFRAIAVQLARVRPGGRADLVRPPG